MAALSGKIALVAGATRGGGRGIAAMLGEAGATVYCSGQSIQGHPATHGRTETIEETAELVSQYGGTGIPVQVDHTVEKQVRMLIDRIRTEQDRLDILVNDVWGGDELTDWEKPFWQHPLPNGLLMQRRGVFSHIITAHAAAPLMVERRQGLIVEITDGDSLAYRGNFFYDLAKTSVMRLAFGMAQDLRPQNVAAVALTPGFLRSEAVLDHFGVTTENWREAAQRDPHFAYSETPFYLGRAVAALAADPGIMEKSGRALSTWGMMEEYGFTDIDGSQPHWGRHWAATGGQPVE